MISLTFKNILYDYEYRVDNNIWAAGMITANKNKYPQIIQGVVFDISKQIGIFYYYPDKNLIEVFKSDNEEYIKTIAYNVFNELKREGLF
jgi:hypothetical protein